MKITDRRRQENGGANGEKQATLRSETVDAMLHSKLSCRYSKLNVTPLLEDYLVQIRQILQERRHPRFFTQSSPASAKRPQQGPSTTGVGTRKFPLEV